MCLGALLGESGALVSVCSIVTPSLMFDSMCVGPLSMFARSFNSRSKVWFLAASSTRSSLDISRLHDVSGSRLRSQGTRVSHHWPRRSGLASEISDLPGSSVAFA